LLERATQSLAHRGPDDHGTVILRESAPEPLELGLGNRRLAILDLSPLGHQPMQDPATGNWLVHNGEIYNFREVRTRLEQEGVPFVSHSDTEVILKAYAQWGEDCVSQFRGMFAFALWDAKRHRLLIARDPMGIKPLYYSQTDRHFDGGRFRLAAGPRADLGRWAGFCAPVLGSWGGKDGNSARRFKRTSCR
jgi:asparagine synthase (glutamine-hydrolysing)